MKNFSILFKAEFRRFWSPAMLIAALGIVGIGEVIEFIIASAAQIQKASVAGGTSLGLVSTFAVLLFSAGIVGGDIRSGWMRTVLIRSVTRQQYVLTKLAVVGTATLLAMLLTVAIPVVYFSAIAPQKIAFDAAATMTFFLLTSCQTILLIIVSAFVSCWLTGAFNSLVVYIWISAAGILEMFIGRTYWNVSWLMTAKDFLFPSGFQNAQTAVKLGASFPTADILWGTASVAFFLSLTLFSINKVQVDVSTE